MPLEILSACSIRSGLIRVNDNETVIGAGLPPAEFLHALYQYLQPAYPKWYKMDKLSQLGLLASVLLLQKLDLTHKAPSGRALVFQSAHGCLDTDVRFADQLEDIPSPAVFVYTLPNIVIGEISIKFGCKGEQAMLLCDKPDAAMLETYVRSLFAEGHTEFCICGWLDVFGEELSATLFAVDIGQGHREFNKQNIQQYFDHEQG
ncbi:MAG TPA: hypothetical protein PLQ32_00315 [Flavihumibacter sp.]|nr:hypothetical protein [Bacteroidota bacterium]HOA36743.1 hypothetical protein [Flavihumibacter sp.]HPZ86513.1 hypothetical protein [Flavihumibacter sp.]HQD09568.1 hypothetical protein [Flavihumibacter sp.]